MAVRDDFPQRLGTRTDAPVSEWGNNAGYGTPSRVSLGINLEAVNNPAQLAVLVQTLFESLANQLNKIFAEKLDNIDSRGRMLHDTYTDKAGRPIVVHKAASGVDVDVEDVFDTVLGDLDDIGDGTVHGRVLNTELTAGQVHQVRDTVVGRDVTGDSIFDKDFHDLDDVDDGTHAKVLATQITAGRVVRIRDVVGSRDVHGSDVLDKGFHDADDLGESASRKWAGAAGADFIKGTDDLDDVSDGSTFLKVTGVSGSNQIQAASIAPDAVTAAKLPDNVIGPEHIAVNAMADGNMFSLAVQTALIDYNTDSGPNTESEWDAI